MVKTEGQWLPKQYWVALVWIFEMDMILKQVTEVNYLSKWVTCQTNRSLPDGNILEICNIVTLWNRWISRHNLRQFAYFLWTIVESSIYCLRIIEETRFSNWDWRRERNVRVRFWHRYSARFELAIVSWHFLHIFISNYYMSNIKLYYTSR